MAEQARAKGGRGHSTVLARVTAWRAEDVDEAEMRRRLSAENYTPSRISHLLGKTRPADATPKRRARAKSAPTARATAAEDKVKHI